MCSTPELRSGTFKAERSSAIQYNHSGFWETADFQACDNIRQYARTVCVVRRNSVPAQYSYFKAERSSDIQYNYAGFVKEPEFQACDNFRRYSRTVCVVRRNAVPVL